MSTWPRQLGLIVTAGFGMSWFVDVLNGAPWVGVVSCLAMGVVLGWAIPTPDEARELAAKGDPDA